MSRTLASRLAFFATVKPHSVGHFIRMPYITQCRAPDLSDLSSPVVTEFILNTVFLGAGIQDRKSRSYTIIFMLSVDKAIREYIAGRELLVRYVASANKTGLLIEGLGRFETCINTVKRALRFMERVATHDAGPEVERLTRRLIQAHEKLITEVRDALEHMDAFIQSDELKEGEPHILAITPDSEHLEIASHRLSFDRLAQLLRRLRQLASEFAKHKDPSPGATESA